MSVNKEVSHYVVTAHPPGNVLCTAKCNFLSPHSKDVLIAKSRRLEVRQLRSTATDTPTSPFPVLLQVPIHGRIVAMAPFSIPSIATQLVFLLTDRLRYAVISYQATATPYPLVTHASGNLRAEERNVLGTTAESGPLVAADFYGRCIALHVYDGLITVLPVDIHYTPSESYKNDTRTIPGHPRPAQVLGQPFHCRVEEQVILATTFLLTDMEALPQLCVLHQGARGEQHLTNMLVNIPARQLHLYGSQSAPPSTQWLHKNMVDGGSSLLIPVPPRLATPPAAAAAAAGIGSIASPDLASGTSSTIPSTGTPIQPSTNKYLTGGVIIVGQQQFTYISPTVTKVLPCRQALFLTFDELPADPNGMPRYLLGDEFGNLHMLTLMIVNDKVVAMQRDTLGSCNLSTSLAYLELGLVYVGSALGDSQLIQIHDEPIPDETSAEASATGEDVELMDTSYLSVVEEYTQLGPILDFDVIPTTLGTIEGPVQVVTASGSSKSGSLRLVRNGIGMHEYAAVEIPGIQNMWSLRSSYTKPEHAYLVQSFVGETRVLGVTQPSASVGAESKYGDPIGMEEGNTGSLEEVFLPGLQSHASTLFVGNVALGNTMVQVTDTQVRLFNQQNLLNSWEADNVITVATANEAGQVAVALQGGTVVYLQVTAGNKISQMGAKKMDAEVSCLDLNPFIPDDRMDDGVPFGSELLAVGLWDDFTVRLLTLTGNLLEEALCINLAAEEEEEENIDFVEPNRRQQNNVMARSLCLVTLDLSSSSNNAVNSNSNSNNQSSTQAGGVDMLFVGMGDGTVVSFAVAKKKGVMSVHSKKEVCLGTQRIDLVPLNTSQGGSCVLATGDRPTVIYLAGLGGTSSSHYNPKLCYSNVNLAVNEDDEGGDMNRTQNKQSIAVNVATAFISSSLFDTTAFGAQHYSLCIADDSHLRLGVIDDIQKLHVTTCRLGMAPRRIVHCSDGRFFAVGCMESGIKHFGLNDEETNMGNCIRCMDDTTFDDLEHIDLEPFEVILSMVYVMMRVGSQADINGSAINKPFLLVGTAYALPNEDEPTKGRILVYTCQADENNASSNDNRAIRQVTELATAGGVYSMCQFFDGLVLCTINSKTMTLHLIEDAGVLRLEYVGRGHHGHILSLFVKSRAKRLLLDEERSGRTLTMDAVDDRDRKQRHGEEANEEEKLAIVGDLMRSISVIQYYPQHKTLEEIARDFNGNWTTAVEMLHANVYLGAENWNNLFCLRRNTASSSEEVRCSLETIGEFHLGEMCNKFMSGSLVMPVNANSSSAKSTNGVSSHQGGNVADSRMRSNAPLKTTGSAAARNDNAASSKIPGTGSSRSRRPNVTIGSQTLFGTVDGTLGVILGLDGKTSVFFSCLERAMAKVIRPVGDLDHRLFRAVETERRIHPAHGFVDGDLVESFLDLDHSSMEAVVREMNRDGGWDMDDEDVIVGGQRSDEKDEAHESVNERVDLSVLDVLAMVEEMTMLH